MAVLIGVPVKRFFVAKRRLDQVLSPAARSRLGRGLAEHTLDAIAAAGGEPLVLAADEEVAGWAKEAGWASVVDGGTGLDDAAAGAVSAALGGGRSWLVAHADLPLAAAADFAAAIAVVESGGEVIAPSKDGGTSLIGASRPIRFSYGTASFHRHLPRLRQPVVLVRSGLALDLDDASDLASASAHPAGRWLDGYRDT